MFDIIRRSLLKIDGAFGFAFNSRLPTPNAQVPITLKTPNTFEGRPRHGYGETGFGELGVGNWECWSLGFGRWEL